MKTPNLDKALKEAAQLIINELIKGLARNGDKNSSLAKNLKYKINKNVIIITMPEYGFALDEGTKPHPVDPEKLEKWANKRGLNAYAVANNIKRFGTKPQPFLLDDKEVDQLIKKTIINAIGVDFKNEIDNTFKKYFK